jgi:hypothetical protein
MDRLGKFSFGYWSFFHCTLFKNINNYVLEAFFLFDSFLGTNYTPNELTMGSNSIKNYFGSFFLLVSSFGNRDMQGNMNTFCRLYILINDYVNIICSKYIINIYVYIISTHHIIYPIWYLQHTINSKQKQSISPKSTQPLGKKEKQNKKSKVKNIWSQQVEIKKEEI